MATELVKRAPSALILSSIGDWMQYAEIVCKTDIVPKEYRGKAADTFVAMQYGSEMGLQPLVSLQSIAVINGKPCVYGDALPAIAFATGMCEDFTELDTEEIGKSGKAVCTIKRRGIPTLFTATFSKEQAQKAGLWSKPGPWSLYPARMLQMRARAWAIRAAFPDKLKGVQVAEEVIDYPTVEQGIEASTRSKLDALKQKLSIAAPNPPKQEVSKPAQAIEVVPEASTEEIPPTPVQADYQDEEIPSPLASKPKQQTVLSPCCGICGKEAILIPAGKKGDREYAPYYRCNDKCRIPESGKMWSKKIADWINEQK